MDRNVPEKYHNGGGVGGYRTGNQTGNGFGGNSSFGGIDEININGSTSLNVTGYSYNGTTYTDVKALTKAIYEKGTTEDVFYVDFTVNGESAPRTARIRANGAANPGDYLTVDYQYKLTYTVPSVSGTAGTTQEVFFYKRDGAGINLPVLSDSSYSQVNGDGIDYHVNKWNVQGQKVSGGNVRINATGDATISNITQDADTNYGFRGNELVVNQTSGTVSVNSAGRSGITQITLPASGSVALDLSQTTNVAIAENGVTNKTALTSVQFPQSNFTVGKMAFQNCTNLAGSIDLSNCTSVGNTAFGSCSGISGAIDLSNCTALNGNSFDGCSNITSVNLGSGVKKINNYDFRGCAKLESINLSNITSIGKKGFQSCSALRSVNLSNFFFPKTEISFI